MWSQARKSYRSPEKTNTQQQRLSTTCLITPFKSGEKPTVRQLGRQCPLHFNQPTHVCLTCRKTICLRCALTYCQSHVIRSQAQALVSLRDELLRLELLPNFQQIQLKLQQSKQRQEYLQKKVLRLIENIQSHFDYIADLLTKKKLQIIQYYDDQFQKFLQQHRDYDSELKQRAEWISSYTSTEDLSKMTTIQEIESLSNQIKRAHFQDSKTQKKITKILMGKDKIKVQKLWTQQNIEKVLLQIENIQFRMDMRKGEKRKKRVTTQNAFQHGNTISFVKPSSNSRFPSGRKHIVPNS